MRDVYYQSTGNPIQVDRLPGSRPATELLPFGNLIDAGKTICTILAIAITLGGLLLLLYRAPGFSVLNPYDLLLAIPVILVGVSIGLYQQSLAPVLHPVMLLALSILSLNHQVPQVVQALSTAAVLGALAYQVGRHAVAIRTVPPMPRQQAELVRASTTRLLSTLGVLTMVVATITLLLRQPLIMWASMALAVSICLLPVPGMQQISRLKLCADSLLSWYTYAPPDLPGLLKSPAGSLIDRALLTLLATQLLTISLIGWKDSPFRQIALAGERSLETVNSRMREAEAGVLERLKHHAVIRFATFGGMVALPVLAPILIALAMSTPAVCEAAVEAAGSAGNHEIQSVIDDLRTSPDPTERDSLFLGRLVADGSPLFVPRKVFSEHAHGLGDSGSGKTSLFLCPLIEQLVNFGDCSVIVLDLKADSLELLATLTAAAQKAREKHGIQLPIKCFSNQRNKPTFAFNPMAQSFWSDFDLLTRTDILCAANGLTYGNDYGAGYFSSANAAVLYHALLTFPHVRTFRELAECIGTVIMEAKKRDLHPEIRKAGVHVQEVMKRLANCEALNVTDKTGHDPAVVAQAIDLTQPFKEPQLLYFHLSATLSPSGAPEIGRLVNYILLAASTQTERKHQVFLVIDEFQRMVASNLEYMLQLARSMGVGVILANQSMEDLSKSSTNLITPIEANCSLRQWFSVSSLKDQERLIRGSGETVDIGYGRSYREPKHRFEKPVYNWSESEKVVPRITMNDVLLTSDHPFRSFVKITRGKGYAQYGGFPVIVESNYHISESEYARRRAMPWPTLPGMLTPGGSQQTPSPISAGPLMTEEVIGAAKNPAVAIEPQVIDAFFDGLKNTLETGRRHGKGVQP